MFNGHPQEYTVRSALPGTRKKEPLNLAQGRLWGEPMEFMDRKQRLEDGNWKSCQEWSTSGWTLSPSLPPTPHLPFFASSCTTLLSPNPLPQLNFFYKCSHWPSWPHSPQNSACATNCNSLGLNPSLYIPAKPQFPWVLISQ